jgi:hypothetical protein
MPLTLPWVVGFRSAQLQALVDGAFPSMACWWRPRVLAKNMQPSLGAREFAPRGRQLEAVECWWNGSVSERSQLRPARHDWGTSGDFAAEYFGHSQVFEMTVRKRPSSFWPLVAFDQSQMVRLQSRK